MQKKTHYTNGQKMYEQKGSTLTYFFKTGIIKAKGKSVGGAMDGKWIFNRESGSLWQVGHFKKGVKHGSWVRYNKVGVLEHEAQYLDGKLVKLEKKASFKKSLPLSLPVEKLPVGIHKDIKAYNKALSSTDRKICEVLAGEISRGLPKAENKIWHAHPVWFLDGNPIVGYDKLKDSVRLLFWSGQSFEEKGLHKEGSFKASEVRYTDVSQINQADLRRWLKKAKTIQWDYKNIRKTKGVLKRLSLKN